MISERLITQIIRHEGAVRRRGRHIPYKCPAGKLTLGYGRNIEENGISDEEAVLLLKNDLTASERELSLCFLWFEKLNEVRREALINMVFNMGISRLKGFKKMLTFLESGDFHKASEEMLNSRWASQVGSRAKELAEQMKQGVL